MIGYVPNGGKVLFFGGCPSEARISLSPFEIFRRQLTLAGSHSLNHNIPEALEVIQKELSTSMGRCGERDIANLSRDSLLIPKGFQGDWE